ncbi:MAG: hypothetical protein ABH950_09955, partial [Candidatus Altiarchaeota archaeon]
PDTDFPANLSLILKKGDLDYEVHFWVFHTPPKIWVEYPRNMSLINQKKIFVEGKVQKGSEVKVNDVEATMNLSSFRSEVSLNEGENRIVVVARDQLGNRSEEVIYVNLDSQVLVKITDPIDDISTQQQMYTVMGTSQEEVKVSVNGQPIDVFDGRFAHEINLSAGENQLKVEVKDLAGNIYVHEKIVNWDTTSSLTINQPKNGDIVGERYVTLSGTAEKNAIVIVNGVEVSTDQSGSFSTNVDISPGENKVKISSIDAAGNTIEKEILVIRDVIAPKIIDLGPKGVQASNQIVLTATTDEISSCKFSRTQREFDLMESSFEFGQGTRDHYTPTSVSSGENIFYISCEDVFKNKMALAESLIVTVGGGVPLASNPKPTGSVSSGTQTLKLNTDEDATCKYDKSDSSFDSMAFIFSSTGGNRHSSEVLNVAQGKNTFYVRCKSLKTGITMTSSLRIEFTLDSSTPSVSSWTPQGTQTSNTVTVVVETNEESTCRIDSQDRSYQDLQYPMSGEEWSHRAQMELVDGTNNLYVRCRDSVGNTMGSSTKLTVYVDQTPPQISNLLPKGTVSNPTQVLNIQTDEVSTCKYDYSDKAYGDMDHGFSSTSSQSHYSTVEAETGLNTFYVRCSDLAGNKMTSSGLIQFTVG